ncbi:hypothetical protein [Bacillus paramycoides]|uniref:Uncharacterized protein n=1 Tax=Bacillus paramycoides TaxID=2026194 RepID=A0ABU6MRH6_9BACI|nr:hypothetical protein [Bacillus paramycoides]
MSYGFGIRGEHELAEQLAHMLDKKEMLLSVHQFDEGGAQVRVHDNEMAVQIIVVVNEDLTFEIVTPMSKKPKKLKQISAVVNNILKLQNRKL